MQLDLAAVAGWTANAFFFSRFLYQWILSERAKRSVTPPAFWWMSLAGSLLLACYLIDTGEPVLLAGVAINAAIYTRNLWAMRQTSFRPLAPLPMALLALLAVAILFATGFARTREGWTDSTTWLLVSLCGQTFWSSRFVLQWSATERHGHSHFPRSFWWFSIAGNALLLAYAIHRRDPILIAGYLPGPITQVRNLVLSLRSSPAAETS